ncbi:NLI interacting factor-like phosphatase-domain-containing protein [Fennellomyces sp. T-0311]|nr:NLI interacting factor-like phosphatase-domain-containing protein [Fennellomyces sp. T-0311]
MVDGATVGWQRRPQSNYRPPGRRGQSSHGRQAFRPWNNRGRYQVPRQQAPLKPSEQYIALSQQASTLLEEPVPKKLLILDLNGTLVSRTKARDSMYVRPYQDKFIDYIFRYFHVMVWSSAQPHSVAYMCELFDGRDNELILKWDRRMFGLTSAQYNSKSITIKDLEKVWKALDAKFDATNTVLLDDSPVKAQLQPYNSIHLREFSHTSPTFHSHGESELLHVVRYLGKVRVQSNVCSFMKETPFVPPDPTQDRDNENSFEAYHYIFGQKERRLVDFRAKEEEEEEDQVTQLLRLLKSTQI